MTLVALSVIVQPWRLPVPPVKYCCTGASLGSGTLSVGKLSGSPLPAPTVVSPFLMVVWSPFFDTDAVPPGTPTSLEPPLSHAASATTLIAPTATV